MSSVPVFVGLDYHQSGVQVCVMNRSGEVLANCKRPDQWQEVARAVAPHGECVQAAIEACSGAADLADQLVQKAGWSVDLAHPGYVARIKQSPDKSDYSDAQLLADLERVGYLPRVWHAPQRIRELRRLVRYRQQLVDQRRNAKLRIRALLRDHRLTLADANPWTKAWRAQLSETPLLPPASRWIMDQHLAEIARLAGQIAQAEEQLAAAIADDPLAQALSALPGVGAGHRRGAPRRDRPLRPVPHRQATGPLLRPHPLQRLQRPPPSRRRSDSRRPTRTTTADHSSRSSVNPPPGSLDEAGLPAKTTRQADSAGGRRRGQPLGPLAAPPVH
jgi:transposase